MGSYRIERSLGDGGFGSVWLATDERSLSKVALKILHPGHLVLPPGHRGPSAVDRFIAEAEVLRRLNVPGVVRVLEVLDDREHGAVAYSMELLDGMTLDVLAEDLALDTLLDVFARVSDALGACHAAGVLHRDVKLSNILISPKDTAPTVTLIDFGIAKDLEGDALPLSTAVGALIGTLSVMAPERLRRAYGEPVQLTGAVDQWSVGVALFRCLTGTSPFRGESVSEVIANIQTQPVPKSRYTSSIHHIIERCLAKSPADRYPSMLVLSRELRTARENLTDRAPVDLATELHLSLRARREETGETVTSTIETRHEPSPTLIKHFDVEVPRPANPSWGWLVAVMLLSGTAMFLLAWFLR